MAARHEVRLVDQVLEELLNNIGEEIIKELVEQQEGMMDKDEQARPGRSSARIASLKVVDYAESRRDCSWTYSEVQALACMLHTNHMKVGRFGPASVQHLVEMGKVWFSYHYFIHIFSSLGP